ncbi:hypothetical protein SAMN05216232_0166 [Virgibacillus subterraneus]|uniref:Uncharacterized protein n=2 Tax=Virgibacillus TaxID=84406 RepID=A0A1H1DY49_9BACI|nr:MULTISPECIES: hypothetical protein [Virgibacillus]SDQ81179.1 hypothetical protein SAMN05216231_2626 [Virgibacillus salinus]SER07010.1 hypothetical protein SAMN05216232_0166 [Virgibacillus subterraneus]
MKYIFLIGSYLLAFSINLMPSIKHPDSDIDILNSLVTILFMVLLLTYSKKGSRILKTFSMFGVISGVIVFVITTFEHDMIGNGILDVIASIQYPFYLIFITPLFGGNILFDLSYGSYSLLMSLFYGAVFVLTTVDSKKI